MDTFRAVVDGNFFLAKSDIYQQIARTSGLKSSIQSYAIPLVEGREETFTSEPSVFGKKPLLLFSERIKNGKPEKVQIIKRRLVISNPLEHIHSSRGNSSYELQNSLKVPLSELSKKVRKVLERVDTLQGIDFADREALFAFKVWQDLFSGEAMSDVARALGRDKKGVDKLVNRVIDEERFEVLVDALK